MGGLRPCELPAFAKSAAGVLVRRWRAAKTFPLTTPASGGRSAIKSGCKLKFPLGRSALPLAAVRTWWREKSMSVILPATGVDGFIATDIFFRELGRRLLAGGQF